MNRCLQCGCIISDDYKLCRYCEEQNRKNNKEDPDEHRSITADITRILKEGADILRKAKEENLLNEHNLLKDIKGRL